MMIKLRTPVARLLPVLFVVVGIALGLYGYRISTIDTPPQVKYYNQGLEAYKNGKMNVAIQLFDKSLSVFKSAGNSSVGSGSESSSAAETDESRSVSAEAEVASLAEFHKGIALLATAKTNPDNIGLAVWAFKRSLILNPGDHYAGLSSTDAQRLHEQALKVKYDLELLFMQNEEQSQQQGTGAEKGDGDASQQAPNKNPSNMPGSGSPGGI